MKKFLCYILICMLALTGCSLEQTDEDMSVSNEVGSDIDRGLTGSSSEEGLTVREIKNTVIGKDLKITIDSEDYNKRTPIYYAYPYRVTDVEFLRLCNRIFDYDSYEIVKPYDLYTENELLDELEYFDSLEKKFPGNHKVVSNELKTIINNNLRYIDIEYSDNDSGIHRGGELPDEYVVLDIKEKMEYGDSIYIFEYNAARAIGTINGRKYQLIYSNETNKNVFDLIYMEPEYYYLSDYHLDCNIIENVYKENFCDLNLSSDKADSILKKIGLEEYNLINTNKRLCNYISKDIFCYDGYRFLFTRSIKGVDTSLAGATEYGILREPSSEYCLKKTLVADMVPGIDYIDSYDYGGEFAFVDVGSEGVLHVRFSPQISTIASYAYNTRKLSVEKIISNLQQTSFTLDEEELQMDELMLTMKYEYGMVGLEEGFAYMPVWTIIEENQGSNVGVKIKAVINAVDGKISVSINN